MIKMYKRLIIKQLKYIQLERTEIADKTFFFFKNHLLAKMKRVSTENSLPTVTGENNKERNRWFFGNRQPRKLDTVTEKALSHVPIG